MAIRNKPPKGISRWRKLEQPASDLLDDAASKRSATVLQPGKPW